MPLPDPVPPATSPPRPGLSRPRDFGHLWTGSAMGHVGSQLTGIALPVLAVNSLGATPWQMGVLAALGSSAFLILGLPAGACVDRWRKRQVLVISDLIRAAALAVIVLAAVTGQLTMAALYVAALVIGVGTVFFDVAHQSFVPALTGPEHIVTGNARLQATESVAQVAGPALGGQLLRIVSASALIAVNAVFYLASALVLRRISLIEPPAGERRRLLVEIGEGLRFVLGHRLLMRMVAATAIGNLAFGIIGALEALYILRHLDLSPATMGAILSIAALGGLGGALSATWVSARFGPRRVIPIFALLMALPMIAIPLAERSEQPAAVLTIGLFVTFYAVVVYNIATVSFRQLLCPPELLGRMNATVRFIVWGTTPIGGLLGGLLGARLGVVPALWVAVIGGFIAAVPVVFSPLWRREPPPPRPG